MNIHGILHRMLVAVRICAEVSMAIRGILHSADLSRRKYEYSWYILHRILEATDDYS